MKRKFLIPIFISISNSGNFTDQLINERCVESEGLSKGSKVENKTIIIGVELISLEGSGEDL